MLFVICICVATLHLCYMNMHSLSVNKKHVISFLLNSCLIFFKIDKWSPALQIRTVLLSIQALLSAPNPDDPLANDVAEKWKLNESEALVTGKCISNVICVRFSI